MLPKLSPLSAKTKQKHGVQTFTIQRVQQFACIVEVIMYCHYPWSPICKTTLFQQCSGIRPNGGNRNISVVATRVR